MDPTVLFPRNPFEKTQNETNACTGNFLFSARVLGEGKRGVSGHVEVAMGHTGVAP